MDGPKIVEHLFFAVTCVATFTCIIRSDYNFAMGLLCYYMIKNASDKIGKIAGTVSWEFEIFCTNYPVFNTYLSLVDFTERDDDRHGRPLDCCYEKRLGRKAHQERNITESVRQHPLAHHLTLHR